MKRAVIVGGAEIRDYQAVKRELNENDFYIFCDSGLCHAEGLGIRPDLIIGDFDSHPMPGQYWADQKSGADEISGYNSHFSRPWTEKAAYGQEILHTYTTDGCEMIVLPRKKDWTDAVYAAQLAAKRGFRTVLLVGASGGRPDLYFSNISILNLLESQGIEAWMADEVSRMRILSAEGGGVALVGDDCRYFSLLAYDGPARGVSIRHALYPLEDAVITAADPYAVSNEVLPGRSAEIRIREGRVLLVIINKE